MNALWLMVVAVVVFIVVPRLIKGKAMAGTIREKLAQGAKIIDVRSREEFRGGAYPGAVNIPLQELDRHLGEFSKETPIVLYCASGARSAAAARAMRSAGFKDVVNAGGLGDMPR